MSFSPPYPVHLGLCCGRVIQNKNGTLLFHEPARHAQGPARPTLISGEVGLSHTRAIGKKRTGKEKKMSGAFCKVTREEGGGISPGRGGAGPKENEFGRAGRTRPKSLWIGADRAVLGFSSVVWAFKKKPSNAFFSTSQFTHGLTTNDGTDRAKKRPTLQGYYDLAVPPHTRQPFFPEKMMFLTRSW